MSLLDRIADPLPPPPAEPDPFAARRKRWTSSELARLQGWGLLGDRAGYELLDGDLGEKHGEGRRSWTAREVQRMYEEGFFLDGPNYELLNGELIEMSPEGPLHVRAKSQLTIWLCQHLPPGIGLVPDSPLRLAEKQEPEPDLYLHPAALDPDEVRGSDTLLVIEVADSSLVRDLRVKAALYAAHRVPLYWIVDGRGRTTLVHRLQGAGYGEPEAISFDRPLQIPGYPEPLILATLLR